MISPKAANYNSMNADRRVSDVYTEAAVDKGLLVGWGYHASPTAATTVVLNESFAAFPESAIFPYDPYPL
ncbi:hypothetical protein ACQ86N_26330 [Puia sp. P3]|uniref:hypothetical protein n=1 Tax=Puia sp. P3 TaxID=3423952 RepID=UPI003D6715EF